VAYISTNLGVFNSASTPRPRYVRVDRTMLPYGQMLEVAFIYEIAIYVDSLHLCKRCTYAQVSVSCESMTEHPSV
jgi:hypothetical protein